MLSSSKTRGTLRRISSVHSGSPSTSSLNVCCADLNVRMAGEGTNVRAQDCESVRGRRRDRGRGRGIGVCRTAHPLIRRLSITIITIQNLPFVRVIAFECQLLLGDFDGVLHVESRGEHLGEASQSHQVVDVRVD